MRASKVLLCALVFYCCKNVQSGYFRSRTTYEPVTEVEKRSIETHPNIALLPTRCGIITAVRYIFGGEPANEHEFPWMALISLSERNFDESTDLHFESSPPIASRRLNNHRKQSGIVLRSRSKRFNDADAIGETGDLLTFKCGGSVINSRYILTAAHCIIKDQKNIGVRVGEHDYSRGETCQGQGKNKVCKHNYQDVEVEEIIPHTGFLESNKASHDIALLRLKKPLNITNEYVSPVCLPITKELRDEPLGGKVGTVAGWGRTETDFSSPVLRKVDVPIKEECNSGQSTDVLCAGEYKRDSCSGDSGGPLMLRRFHGGFIRVVEIGIVSNGPIRCGSEDKFGIYTDVSKHMDWILDNIRP